MQKLLALFFFLALISCSTHKETTSDFYEENPNVNLYAFVGKKISVEEFDPNLEQSEKVTVDSITGEKIIQKKYIMDIGFRCKYLVIKNVFNKLQKDTINFVAYDHYGKPHFENSELVLLYISKNNDGKYYHQKYQFDDLKIDNNGMFQGTIYKIKKRRKYETHIPKRATIKELFYNKKKKVFKNLFENKNGG